MSSIFRPVALLATILLVLAAPEAVEKESKDIYRERRARLMEQTSDGAVILFGESGANLDVFKQENNFFYLTGVETPNAILALDSKQKKETLYLPERDPAQERWTGPQIGPNDAEARETGIAEIKSRELFQGDFDRLAASAGTIYTLFPSSDPDIKLTGDERANIEKIKSAAPFVEVKDVAPIIAEMRKKKSPHEIRLLQKAIDITGEAHLAAARALRPGLYEYQIQAIIEHAFKNAGAERPGFASIVGSGPNSTVLHYNQNRRLMREGEVVVIDIGAEYSYYTADITRTYPVSGRFTPRQREIYEIVLGAQKAAVERLRPGATLRRTGDIHRAAYDYINSHGKDLKGEPLGKYFIHGTSHYLGMDVHDVGDYTKPLEPGEVITIEPGIYIPEENIGVRIEDDFLVTETGYVHLSKNIPREVEEIEKLMAARPRERIGLIERLLMMFGK